MFPILSDPSSLLLNLMLLTPVVAVPGEPHTSDHLLLLLFIGFLLFAGCRATAGRPTAVGHHHQGGAGRAQNLRHTER